MKGLGCLERLLPFGVSRRLRRPPDRWVLVPRVPPMGVPRPRAQEMKENSHIIMDRFTASPSINIEAAEPDIVYVVDGAWRIEYATERACRLVDKPLDQLVGRPCQEVLEEVFGPNFMGSPAQCKAMIASGKAICDIRLEPLDPERAGNRFLFLTVVPVFDMEGGFDGAVMLMKRESHESSVSQLILDSIADGVFTVNRQWEISNFNKAAEELTGWRREEVYGRPCSEVFKSNVCGENCFMAQALRQGHSVHGSVFMKRSDGRVLPVHVSASPLLNLKGEVIGGVESFRDVTAMAEKELILDSIADGVFTVDKELRVTAFNRAAQEITGYSPEQAIGKHCHEVFKSNICGALCPIAKSMKSGEASSRDMVFIRRADGKTLPISVHAAPLLGPDGEIIGGVEVFRDQTEPVLYNLIIDSVADGVFTVDRQSRITSFNKAAEQITGHSAEEAIGKACHDIFKSNICGTSCAIAQALQSGVPVANRSVTIERADGKKVPISVSAAPLMDPEGNIIGGVETFRDLSLLISLRKQLSGRYGFGDIISKSPVMRKIFAILPDVAQSDSNVLILGDSGTGKELLARAIHGLSARKNHPFVAVNCGALPDTLLESELFGHKAGAFTDAKRDRPGRFAAAEHGTLFLDEIGDVSTALQVKLLRVLQEKTYEPLGSNKSVRADVRIIAATNRDLEEQVKKGEFREDLYYRLNVVKIQLPSLKERREDIPLLVDHFISKFNAEKGREVEGISQEALDLLMRYEFPGNIRELENIIEYAFILCHGGVIEVEHLPEPLAPSGADQKDIGLVTPMTLAEVEKLAIEKALERNRWKKMATCRELGISKDTLRRKIKRYGIEDSRLV